MSKDFTEVVVCIHLPIGPATEDKHRQQGGLIRLDPDILQYCRSDVAKL